MHREVAQDLLPWCAEHGTGVIVYSPMASGSFTVQRAAALGSDDWRSASDDFVGEGLARNLALVEAVRPVADRHGVSVGAVAIAWTLAFDRVTGAIVGARSPEQVDGWLPAAGLTLDDADRTEIAAALSRWGTGSGPTRPSV